MARKQSNGNLPAHESASESEGEPTSPAASEHEFDEDAAAAAEATSALVRQRDLLFQWHIAREGRDVRFSEYKMDKDGNALVLMNTREGDLVIPIPKENLHKQVLMTGNSTYKMDDTQVLKLTNPLAFEKHLRALLRGFTKTKKTLGPKRTRAKKPSKKSADDSGSGKASSTS